MVVGCRRHYLSDKYSVSSAIQTIKHPVPSGEHVFSPIKYHDYVSTRIIVRITITYQHVSSSRIIDSAVDNQHVSSTLPSIINTYPRSRINTYHPYVSIARLCRRRFHLVIPQSSSRSCEFTGLLARVQHRWLRTNGTDRLPRRRYIFWSIFYAVGHRDSAVDDAYVRALGSL